jgi:hypothetical protein
MEFRVVDFHEFHLLPLLQTQGRPSKEQTGDGEQEDEQQKSPHEWQRQVLLPVVLLRVVERDGLECERE